MHSCICPSRFVRTRTSIYIYGFQDKLAQFNSLPNNKIVDWSNLKASADDKIYVTEKSKFVLGRVEDIVGKGENAGYHNFLLFP